MYCKLWYKVQVHCRKKQKKKPIYRFFKLHEHKKSCITNGSNPISPSLMSSSCRSFHKRISSFGHKVNWLASWSSFIASSHFAHRVQGPIPFHPTHPSFVCTSTFFPHSFTKGRRAFSFRMRKDGKKDFANRWRAFLAHVSCVVNNHILLPFPPPFKRKQTNQFISFSLPLTTGQGRGAREKSDYRYFLFCFCPPQLMVRGKSPELWGTHAQLVCQ